ncbi:MAG: PEP/pyruvate-binding domain-containing protein [Acidobacteria bacterium]|nr:PEP/pyruvate-binding domain-containing protein [Acidobacteriota bacterium]
MTNSRGEKPDHQTAEVSRPDETAAHTRWKGRGDTGPTDENDTPASHLVGLEERAKELQCLYAISDVLENPQLSPAEVFRDVVGKIPDGWQHPERCRARLSFDDSRYETPGFQPTPWVQRASIMVEGRPAGAIEVAYVDYPATDPDPFLFEEQKLANTIASWVGRYIQARRIEPTGNQPLLPGVRPGPPRKPEWEVILDLLKDTDAILWRRILRRLMNYLSKLGVPGVQKLIQRIDPATYVARDRESTGNQPLPKQDLEIVNRLFDEIIRIASIVVSADDMTVLLKQWIRQDKMGFLALATEQRDLPLAELSEIIDRFCRSAREGEAALSPSDDLNVRAALTQRFMTERLPVVGAAKRYLTIHDFGRLLNHVIGRPQGTGKIGGKAAGLFLAEHILRRDGRGNPLIETIRVPHTWYILSDGVLDFIRYNSLEDIQSVKYSSIEEIQQGHAYLEQTFKHSFFPPELTNGLKLALDDLGDWPLIVRSSSLLEDNEGASFSGKYRSLFLPNMGSKDERLAALTDAIAEVYASLFGPDPIQYRKERGLLDFNEQMAVLIQRVVGTRVGRYFFPAFAGVAFSHNEFRWSPRIKRDDGMIRLVAGLGTRAVDRVGDDYPALLCPGQPGLRVNATVEETLHYSQQYLDVINLTTGQFESKSFRALLQEVGAAFPLLDKIVSVHADDMLRRTSSVLLRPDTDDTVITFAGLVETTGFVKQIREILGILSRALGGPVDVEFAHDGRDLYLLQYRPQSSSGDERRVPVPGHVPASGKIFSANRYVTNAQISGIRYVVYVDPIAYGQLGSMREMCAVGDVVSRLNGLLPRRTFILVGPGRWGSRGDLTLGVRVTYAGICNAAMLVEVARKTGSYVPDLSFGTHFFQDLVEARIRYLALYPDEDGIVFNESFFLRSPNALATLLPEYAYLAEVVRVIDVAQVADGHELHVVMDGEKDEALGFLARP